MKLTDIAFTASFELLDVLQAEGRSSETLD